MRLWGRPWHKHKHKHKHELKNVKTLRSSHAYAYAYVAVISSEDRFGICISISTRLLDNQWTQSPRPLPRETKWRAMQWLTKNWQNLSENSQSFMTNRQKISKINIRRAWEDVVKEWTKDVSLQLIDLDFRTGSTFEQAGRYVFWIFVELTVLTF